MSDSDVNMPPDAVLSKKLREIVIAIHKSGNTDDLTVKRVRMRAEKELGLDEGFFKTNSSWKRRSQEEIVEAVDKYCQADPSPQPTPNKAAAKPKAKSASKVTNKTAENARGVKRKAAAPPKQPAKRKKSSSDEEPEAKRLGSSGEISAKGSDVPKKPTQRVRRVVNEDSEGEDEVPQSVPQSRINLDEDESDVGPARRTAKEVQSGGDISDSDLSSVIDEEPVKKQREKKGASVPAKKEPKPKPAKQPKAVDDPDQAKIKELQGWLLKCGIRKVWSRDAELLKCDTSKEKISVLKAMLKDVGMDGKFSVEKAAKIKEQREFAKDLEAIKEGELAWGKTSEVTNTGRPSRRATSKAVAIPKILLEDESEDDMDTGDHQDINSSDDDEDDDVESDSDDADDPSDGSEVDDSE